jgi:regulatory protein
MAPRRPVRAPRRRDAPPLDAKASRRAAADLLARRAWSTRELTRRLVQRGAPADVARAVVAELESRGYLGDEGFARWWAQVRAERRHVGSLRLRRELAAKGVSRDLAATAVEAAFEETSELDRALEAARRRLPTLLRAAPDRAPGRLAAYLLRRGYPPALVRRVVRRLTGAELREISEGGEGV